MNERTNSQTIINPQPGKPYSYGDHKSKRHKFYDGSFAQWEYYFAKSPINRPQKSDRDKAGNRI